MQPADRRVVSTFIGQALTGEPSTIFVDGEQTRSLCSVNDLISGLEIEMPHESSNISLVNVGNPSELTLNQLAEHIRNLKGSVSKVEHNQLPQDYPKHQCPDITRMTSMSGWTPKTELEEGLREAISGFRYQANR